MDKRVGFGPRLGAWLIDAVVLCVAIVVIGPMIGGIFGAAAMGEAARQSGESAKDAAAMGGLIGAIGGFVIGAPIIGTAYFLVEAFTGYSLGKLAVGLRIGSADGTLASTQKLLIRFACKHVHFVLGVLGLLTLGLLTTLGSILGVVSFFGCFAALGDKKQALHDMIAGTAVYPKAALQPAMAEPAI